MRRSRISLIWLVAYVDQIRVLQEIDVGETVSILLLTIILALVAVYAARKMRAFSQNAKDNDMSLGPVWLPQELQESLENLMSLTGGYPPIFSVVPDDSKTMPSSLHVPTLYPQQTVPVTAAGNWGSVAAGLYNQTRSLMGMPELKCLGNDSEKEIAREINEELESLAAAKAGVQPRSLPVPHLLEQTQTYIDAANTDRLRAQDIFFAFRLCRLRYETHCEADNAIDLFQNVYPEEFVKGESLFSYLIQIDLDTPVGKANAIIAILDRLKFGKSKFYFHQYQFSHGQTQKHSLEYFQVSEDLSALMKANLSPPYALIEFELPFHIPAKDGLYSVRDSFVSLVCKTVTTSRATWQAGNGAQIDAIMDPTGLYRHTEVLISIAGRPRHDDASPPVDEMYRNVQSYPAFAKLAVSILNELIAALRISSNRCDIPDIVPGHLNKCSFRQFGDNGDLERDFPAFSLEYIHLSNWSPNVKQEISERITKIRPSSLARELTEAAKNQVLSLNVRRGILDFAGAFEAFLAEYISPKIGDIGQNTIGQFLSLYASRLTPECTSQLEELEFDGDTKRKPSVFKIVKEYEKCKCTPTLGQNIKTVMRIHQRYRNPAAHGEVVSDEALGYLIEAISALDELHDQFECASA